VRCQPVARQRDVKRVTVKANFDKQSVAGLRNNRTVLCNPYLGDGLVNRLPRRRNDVTCISRDMCGSS
jgi:hypothetical protein